MLSKQRLAKQERYNLQQSRQRIAVMIPIKATSNEAASNEVSTNIEIEITSQNPQ